MPGTSVKASVWSARMLREIWRKRRDRRPGVELIIVLGIMLALPFLLRPARGEMRRTAAAAAPAPVDLGGRLCGYVLSGAWEPASGKALDEARLSPELQARVQQFRARTKQVRSRITRPRSGGSSGSSGVSDTERDGFFERQVAERALVALFDGPGNAGAGIAAEAAAYAQRAPFSYEYEGHPDGPREEIAYTRAYLTKHPATRLAPYLWLLLAQRERVLFEIYGERKDVAQQQVAAREYREALQHARASDDVLFRAACDDLDLQPFVYLPVPKGAPAPPHPGTYR
jgi:hypothetical protein